MRNLPLALVLLPGPQLPATPTLLNRQLCPATLFVRPPCFMLFPTACDLQTTFRQPKHLAMF